jgi:hypothetical protein
MRFPFSFSRIRVPVWVAFLPAFCLLLAVPAKQAKAATNLTIPAGTSITGALESTVSDRNQVGDPVRLRTTYAIRRGGVTVVPANSVLHGEVTHRDGPGRVAGSAELSIRFTRLITPDGRSYPISATPIRLKGKNDAGKSAKQIGGGAVAGGVLGGIIGGKGSVIKGAAAGAAVGTGVAVAGGGKHIVLPAGQRLRVTLNTPVTVRKSSTQT